MNGSNPDPFGPRRLLRAYLWSALAVLSCPCHLPIVAVVLPDGHPNSPTFGHPNSPT